jgi:biopolymer transport protein ExbD
MRVPEESDAPIELNIVPMLDVVFSILTFFIMSTLFLTRSEGISVNLPKAATAKPQQQTKIAMSIRENGQLALNKKPVQLNQIEPGVRALVQSTGQSSQQPVVVIHADGKVNHEQVVAVMDEVRKIASVKMAIATQRQ